MNCQGRDLSERQRANMSGWLLENQNQEILLENLESLIQKAPPSFTDRADRLLFYISKQTDYVGQDIELDQKWISSAWCINEVELEAFIKFLCETGRLEKTGANKAIKYAISSQGWLRIEELNRVNIESNQGFVAMWFNSDIRAIYDEVISEAIHDAGYRAHTVDQREHNDKIDDEIISQIRRSRFVVADFTGHRGGVYYEAGFAKGLGLEVFWLCREDDVKSLHFDIRQYNCIIWNVDKKEEFKRRLTNRIESILGHGPFKR